MKEPKFTRAEMVFCFEEAGSNRSSCLAGDSGLWSVHEHDLALLKAAKLLDNLGRKIAYILNIKEVQIKCNGIYCEAGIAKDCKTCLGTGSLPPSRNLVRKIEIEPAS